MEDTVNHRMTVNYPRNPRM